MTHWLNTELWGPMWPNMFAPSAFTLIGLVVSHIKRARQAERHHQELKQHVTETLGGAPDSESEGK